MNRNLKKVLLITMTCFCLQACRQDITVATIENPQLNYVYVNYTNPIKIQVNNIDCSNYVLTTSNGKVEKGSKQCEFVLIPKNLGLATLSISEIKNNDTIVLTKKDFRVKPIPDPIARVNGLVYGQISKEKLNSSSGVSASIENMIDIEFYIKSYNLLLIQNNSILYDKNINNDIFQNDKELKNALLSLRKGDKVFVYDIKVTSSNLEKRLNSIDLTIE